MIVCRNKEHHGSREGKTKNKRPSCQASQARGAYTGKKHLALKTGWAEFCEFLQPVDLTPETLKISVFSSGVIALHLVLRVNLL